MRQLLTRCPHDRLSASGFQHSPLFDNILMNSIKFLDSFPEKTKSEKTSFLRGFVTILPQFSDRIRHRKVIFPDVICAEYIDPARPFRTRARYGFVTIVTPEHIRHNEEYVTALLLGTSASNGPRYYQDKRASRQCDHHSSRFDTTSQGKDNWQGIRGR